MTTLIFATRTDASPLIDLQATENDIRQFLADLDSRQPRPEPGRAATGFLMALSPDQWDEWQPSIESTPIFSLSCITDHPCDLLVYDPEERMVVDIDAFWAAEDAKVQQGADEYGACAACEADKPGFV